MRKAEFDKKTSEASHGFLERMPIVGTMDALAIFGRELVENNTLKECFVGSRIATSVCKRSVGVSASVACAISEDTSSASVACCGFSSDVMQWFKVRRNDQHMEVGCGR